MAEPVGPPYRGPIEDIALETVKRAQQKPEDSKIQDLWPMILATAADLGSTEYALAQNPGAREGNPIPGMGSTAGRIGINVGALLALHYLTKGADKKKARNILKWIGTGTHGAAAVNNMIQARK